MTTDRPPIRRAQIDLTTYVGSGRDRPATPSNEEALKILERTRALLPDNYKAGYNSANGQIIITGRDHAGWTLDDYVLPRLASGLIFAKEIT